MYHTVILTSEPHALVLTATPIAPTENRLPEPHRTGRPKGELEVRARRAHCMGLHSGASRAVRRELLGDMRKPARGARIEKHDRLQLGGCRNDDGGKGCDREVVLSCCCRHPFDAVRSRVKSAAPCPRAGSETSLTSLLQLEVSTPADGWAAATASVVAGICTSQPLLSPGCTSTAALST